MHALVRWQFRGDIPETEQLEKLPTAITVLPVGVSRTSLPDLASGTERNEQHIH
jgi:hypothetical protein